MVILVAASGQRHFELSDVDFAAYNIVFLNGTATDQYGGGSILAQSGSSLTLSQVVFVDNRATWDGYNGGLQQSATDYGGRWRTTSSLVRHAIPLRVHTADHGSPSYRHTC